MFATYYRASTTVSLCTMAMITTNVALIVSSLLLPDLTFSQIFNGSDTQRYSGFVFLFLTGLGAAFLIASVLREFNIGAPKPNPIGRTRTLVLAVALLLVTALSFATKGDLNFFSVVILIGQAFFGLAMIFCEFRSPQSPNENTAKAS